MVWSLDCIDWCKGHWLLKLYGCEAVRHKLKNSLKTQKKQFLPVFELLQSLNHIGWATLMPFASINPTNPRTNPWNFKNWRFWKSQYFFNLAIFNFLCLIPMKTNQSSFVSKNGSKFWSSQKWQDLLTQTKHYAPECMSSTFLQYIVKSTPLNVVWKWFQFLYVLNYEIHFNCSLVIEYGTHLLTVFQRIVSTLE